MKEKIMFDELVDDIVNRIDPAGHNTDGLKKHYRLKLSILVNQEVDRRIAERMPTVDDAENAQLTYEHKQTDCLDRFSYIHCYRDFMAGIDWLRSRLSQKTEGGGE